MRNIPIVNEENTNKYLGIEKREEWTTEKVVLQELKEILMKKGRDFNTQTNRNQNMTRMMNSNDCFKR